MYVERPRWTFEDLGLMLGAILPSLLAGVLVVRAGRAAAPQAFANEGVSTLVYQCAFYGVLLAALYLLTVVRYREPFWRALRWTMSFRVAWVCLLAAPFPTTGLSPLRVLPRHPA